MAQTIKLRRSAVAGNVPTTSQLGLGELAINTADGKIYFEKNDGSATIQTIVTTNSQTTGSIEVTGNISGSATSTGSFGVLKINGGQIASDGNDFGIGTSTPTSPGSFAKTLQISTPDDGASVVFTSDNDGTPRHFEIGNTANGRGIIQNRDTTSNGYIQISTNNTRRMLITKDGDVNITNTLYSAGNNAKLYVDGKVLVDGNLEVTGSVSGSSTSTGSFGELNIKRQRIYERNNDLIIEGPDGENVGDITFRTGHGSGVRDVAHVDYAGAVVIGVGATIPADNHTGGGGSLTVFNTGTSIIKIANNTTGQDANSGTDLQLTSGTSEFLIINRDATDIKLKSNSNEFRLDASANAWSGSSTSTGSFGRIEVPSTGSFTHIENSTNLRSAKLSLTGGGGGDTTLVVTNHGGGNLLTLTNAATSILYDGRHGQSSAGLYFNITSTAMLGNLASSATVPAFKFSGDTDTGIGRSSANVLSLIAGGVSGAEVTSTGISGSATSTGSFGVLAVGGAYANNTGITVHGTSRLNGSIDLFGTGNASQINMAGSDGTTDGILFSTTDTIGFLDAGGSDAIKHINDNGTYFYSHGGTEVLRLNVNSAEFRRANYKISGSSTSTGSFGKISVNNNVTILPDAFGIGTTAPAKRVHIQQGNSNSLHEAITIRTNSSGEGLMLGINADNSGYMYSTNAAAKGLRLSGISSARATGHLFISSSGDAIFSNNISGSATSTGSFGSLVVRGSQTIQGTTEYEGDLNVAGLIASTGDMTLDAGGNIILDADGAQIRLQDGGTEFGRISRVSSDLVIKSISNNNDILFKGVDGSSTITALQLDMSEGGNAIFNGNVSGSAISTGSFGHIKAVGNITGSGVRISQGKLTLAGTTSGFGAGDIGMTSGILVMLGGSNGIVINGHSGGLDANGFTFTAAKVSGSAISTGSFGRVETAGNIDVGGFTTLGNGISSNGGNFTISNSATEPQLDIKANGVTTIKLRTGANSYISTGNDNTAFMLGTTSNQNSKFAIYNPTTANHKYSINVVDQSSNRFTVDIGGNVTASGHISSSATSTASFGNGYFDGNVQVNGNVIAQEFHTEFVSASIVFQSGSTKFGDTLDDVHQFTGSLKVTGSVHNVEGQLYVQKASDPLVQVSDGTRTMLAGYITSTSGLVGTTTNHPLAIRTNNTDRINITNGGNVGINKTAPTDTLHVVGGITMEAANAILAMNVTNTTGACQIRFGDTGDSDIGKIVYGHNTNAMSFNTADAERLRIDSSGKVGIGTNAPAAILHINADEPELFLKHTGTSGDDKTLITFGDKNGQVHAQFFTKLKNDSNGGAFDSEFHLQTAADGTVADRIVVEEDGKAVIFPTANALISGSSTSTGSFGRVYGSGNTVIAGTITTGNHIQGSVTNAGGNLIYGAGASGFRLRGANSGTETFGSHEGALKIKASSVSAGNYNLTLAASGTGKIIAENDLSGSATSTGSFSQIQTGVGGKILANTTNNARTHVIIADGNIGGPTYSGTYINLTSGHNQSFANNDFRFYSGEASADLLYLDAGATSATFVTDIISTKANGVISGSATSTGSFGELQIHDKIGVMTTTPGAVSPASPHNGSKAGLIEIKAASSGGDAALLLRRFEGDGTYGMDLWTDTNAADSYIDQRGGVSGAQLYIRTATHTSAVNAAIFDHVGNVEFPSATTISGSATSTGSFGHLLVNGTTVSGGGGGGSSVWSTNGNKIYYNADNVGIGTNNPGLELDIQATAGPQLRLKNTNQTNGSEILLDGNRSSDLDVGSLIFQNAGTTIGAVAVNRAGADNSGQLELYTYNAGSFQRGIVIQKTGVVGIGTNDPLGNKLHLHVGDSGVDSVTTNSTLVLESNTNNYIQFLNPNGNNAGIIFGEHNDIDVASIRHDGGGNFLRFIVNTAEALRITASRNISIGHTSDPSNSAKLGVAGNINVGNGQASSIVYLENSGTDMYIEGNANKLNIGSVGNTQAVTFPAGGGIQMNAGNVSGSAESTGSFGKGKIDSGIIEGKGSSNTYIELTGHGYPNDNFKVHIAGVKSLHVDNNAGGVMMGYAASATGDSVAIGFGASSAASTVAIGRGISSAANEIRIGESGNTDAYLAQGNATLHIAGINSSGNVSGSSTSTGSFGSLVVSDRVQGSLTIASDLIANGNVGIGTTSPDEALHLSSATSQKPVIKLEQTANMGNGAGITFLSSGNADDNDIPGTIRFKALNDASEETEYSTIYAKNIDVSNGTEDGELHFRTISNGNLDTRMILKSSYVGIGTTTPSQALEVAGAALINNGSSNHHLYFGNTSYGIHVVHSTGVMNFVSNSSTRMSIANGGNVSITGNLLPTADNSSDLGSSSKRWANIYSADLHLSNEGTGGNEIDGTEGNWTIQEGEEDLYLLNNKNGKKYKFVLQEIE